MLDSSTVTALMAGDHGDPFAVLGLHTHDERWVLRALLPGYELLFHYAPVAARS